MNYMFASFPTWLGSVASANATLKQGRKIIWSRISVAFPITDADSALAMREGGRSPDVGPNEEEER